MRFSQKTIPYRRIPSGVLLLLALAVPATLSAQPKQKLDPKVTAELRRMSDFLAKQQSFTVNSESTLDIVEGDKKSQEQRSSMVSLQRPNKLRVDRRGTVRSGQVIYDGKQLSIAGEKYWATTPAPPKLDEALDFAIDALDLVPPGVELLYSSPYDRIVADARSATDLGTEEIAGKKVRKFALKGADVDWEVWIQEGDQPLPVRMTFVSKNDPQTPAYTVNFSGWNFKPALTADTFRFVPPEGAEQIQFLAPPKQAPAQAREGKSQR